MNGMGSPAVGDFQCACAFYDSCVVFSMPVPHQDLEELVATRWSLTRLGADLIGHRHCNRRSWLIRLLDLFCRCSKHALHENRSTFLRHFGTKAALFVVYGLTRVAHPRRCIRRSFSWGFNLDMFRLDYVSCCLTVLATILLGRKSWTGLIVAIANSSIVCVIGLQTSQLGFIPANLFCICVYALSIRSWLKQSHTQKPKRDATVG